MTLPAEVYSVSQVRQLEAAAVAAGTPGYALMQRAGTAACALLRQRWPEARQVVVIAGPGNNGGDGLVLAQRAQQGGLNVKVMLLAEPAGLRGEAAQAYADLGSQLAVQPFDAQMLAHADVVVDALLGIGARSPLRHEWQAAIAAMNNCGRPVLAIDLPSGLDPDSGRADSAVRAAATITFLALKQGLFQGDGPEHVGDLHFESLDAVADTSLRPALRRLTDVAFCKALAPRPRQSHKSQFGRVLIIGGGSGMPGAVRLAAESALRVGAGLVSVASLPEHLATVVGTRPELMFRALRSGSDVAAAVDAADVIAIGPGLGRDHWARDVLSSVFAARRPQQHLVVDADALNLIAEGVGLQRCEDWVLTPHPGEAARLLGISTQDIQRDRLAALQALCDRRGGTIVLKGAMTLVGHAQEVPQVCDRGNPGMAVPGMGDILTGAIAGILAQCGRPLDASAAAVYAHAVAGDRCARGGLRGVLALEVAQELRAALANLS